MDELHELLSRLRPRLSDRKLRLLACAAARKAWHLLKDSRSRRAIEVAEAFADGQATANELRVARGAANHVREGQAAFDVGYVAGLPGRGRSFSTVWWRSLTDGLRFPAGALAAAAARAAPSDGPWQAARDAAWAAARDAQRALAMDMVGPECAVVLDPTWLTWNDSAVRKLAQAIYAEHRFDDLPILADALEEAGCADADILGHCRSGGEHARGCWVVDLLLGKQ